MPRPLKIAAFGALNTGSYEMFRDCLAEPGLAAGLACAGPYPNAEARSVPGRPLRADALKDPTLKEELFAAVAGDARTLGEDFDIYCMPCMSMIGFHEGVEQKLGRPIIRLADALTGFYSEVPKLGVIHMRPAAQRVQEMFGGRAVTPDEAQAEKLLAVEGNADAVAGIMKDITESFRDRGLSHVLFARADAPKAIKGPAGRVEGIRINSYFDILAKTIAAGGTL